MAEQNQEIIPVDPASFPLRRKRGRPRKYDSPGYEPCRRNRQSQDIPTEAPLTHANPIAGSSHESDDLIGRKISGILEGTFDAGYLLAVQVGETGTVLKGMVFDPHRSVPLTAENDIAPFLPMMGSKEIPHSVSQASPQAPVSMPIHPVSKTVTAALPLQMREPITPPPVNNLVESSRLPQTAASTKEVVQNNADHLTQDVRPALQTDLRNKILDALSRKKANNNPPKSLPAAPGQSLLGSVQTGPLSGPMTETMPATIKASTGGETENLVGATGGCESSDQIEGSPGNVSRIEQSVKTLTGNETSGGKLTYTGSDETLMVSKTGGGNSDIIRQSPASDKNLMGNEMPGGEMHLAGEAPHLSAPSSENR